MMNIFVETDVINLKKEKNIYTLMLKNKPVNALSQELISELLINGISDWAIIKPFSLLVIFLKPNFIDNDMPFL